MRGVVIEFRHLYTLDHKQAELEARRAKIEYLKEKLILSKRTQVLLVGGLGVIMYAGPDIMGYGWRKLI